MAIPITSIKKIELSAEEIQETKMAELQSLIIQQEQAFTKILEVTGDLDDIGVFDALKAMVKAKEGIAKIAVDQVSREPVTNLINHAMGAAGALSSIDPEMTTKLLESVKRGLDEADLHDGNSEKIGPLTLMKSLSDPDINRAIKFGLHFMKGMGKGLDGK